MNSPDNPSLVLQQNFSDYPVDGVWKDGIYYIITGFSEYHDPQPANIKYINGNNFSIMRNIKLDHDPCCVSVNDSNIFITNNSAEFNIFKNDSSLTLVEKQSFDYGTGRFIVDNPYVYLCQVHSLTTFKLGNPILPPGTPSLISPSDGSATESLTPTLDWSDVPCVKSYTVQVSNDMNFATITLNQRGVLLSEYKIPYGLLSDKMLYYWRVSANNEGGAGPWSNVWNFRPIIIVPVELISFSGRYDPQIMSILLTWETATETNNYGFEIEKYDSNEWGKIGFVKGNGTSTSHHIYTFTENLRNSKLSSNYCIRYRLKQIDFDGTYEYSDAIEVSMNHELIFKLNQNYPNPFNPKTTILFSLPQSSFVTLKIYDILGREVTILLKENKQPGVYSITFDASNLPSGLYFYKLQAGSFVNVKKMNILR